MSVPAPLNNLLHAGKQCLLLCLNVYSLFSPLILSSWLPSISFLTSAHSLSVPSPPASHSLLPPPQCPEWWQCRLRCVWWRTTLHLCHWWKSTNSAVPRRASSMTTPFPVIMTVWPLCRPEARRPATRYSSDHLCINEHSIGGCACGHWMFRMMMRRTRQT